MVLQSCNSIITQSGKEIKMSESLKMELNRKIREFGLQSYRVIGLSKGEVLN